MTILYLSAALSIRGSLQRTNWHQDLAAALTPDALPGGVLSAEGGVTFPTCI